MNTILICDDDKDIVSALDIYLTAEGYRTVKAYNGVQAVEAVRRGGIDLILMDIMMPEMDGIRATAKLREEGNIPIILLTAKSEDTDKVLGLNIGADDYVTKPFNPIEVIARVKSQLRRYTTLGGKTKEESDSLLRNGGIAMDDGAKTVTVDGEPVTLTPIEYNILRLLMKNPGRVYCSGCSCPTRGRCSPPPRSTSRCGTTRRWALRARWPSTFATCGRKSRSTPPSPAT